MTGSCPGPGVPVASDPGATGAVLRFTRSAALSKSEVFDLCDVLWQAQRSLEHVGRSEVAESISRWIEVVEGRIVAPDTTCETPHERPSHAELEGSCRARRLELE